jgi:hypothetical protein
MAQENGVNVEGRTHLEVDDEEQDVESLVGCGAFSGRLPRVRYAREGEAGQAHVPGQAESTLLSTSSKPQ